MTLSTHFNRKSPRCENDLRVGDRKETDGSTLRVRAGKIMSRIWPDGAKDKYGAEVKESKLKQQAEKASEGRRERARPVQTHRNFPRAP
jgi:hypothetical protein